MDFNFVNELFITVVQKLNSTVQETLSVNELKLLLTKINSKVDTIEEKVQSTSNIIQLTYDQVSVQKEFYVEQIKNILATNQNQDRMIKSIQELNTALIDKIKLTMLQEIPKINNTQLDKLFQQQQTNIVSETTRAFQPLLQSSFSSEKLEQTIQSNYETIYQRLSQTFQSHFNQDSSFYQTNLEIRQFLEKQKNSTLKGKESEQKLEGCLISAFPHATIQNTSGEAKSCDYRLERLDKPKILIENKDYGSNVPNEEIKKFIRDIEHHSTHGILLSQHSGITNKQDYQIDIHADNIIIFVHFVNYNESKIRIAVNLIDHLDGVIQQHKDMNQTTQISMEQLSEINKEYLQFIGQKKQLIELYKKSYKDQLRHLEEFEMPSLTHLLNSKFTNVEQLSYKCDICNAYNAKNKRALVTHKNKCKKNIIVLDET